MTRLAIIMPVLNEAAGIADTLRTLSSFRARGVQLIVVDGGSEDGTREIAQPLVDLVITAPRGRAMQMNVGAAAAATDIFLFLHADTRLPEEADRLVIDALRSRCWGRFDVMIVGRSPMLRVIGAMMNIRSRLTGIATGDQAIFVTRPAFDSAGGFPAIRLMEDIALSRALKRAGPPACLPARVSTSGRRWEQNGIWRTIFLMWYLRAAFALGADPAKLAVRYGYRPAPNPPVQQR